MTRRRAKPRPTLHTQLHGKVTGPIVGASLTDLRQQRDAAITQRDSALAEINSRANLGHTITRLHEQITEIERALARLQSIAQAFRHFSQE